MRKYSVFGIPTKPRSLSPGSRCTDEVPEFVVGWPAKSANKKVRRAVTGLLLLLAAVVVGAKEKPYVVLDNFSSGLKSSNQIRSEQVLQGAKEGLAMAKLKYTLDPRQYYAGLRLDRPLGDVRGTLQLWVKGNNLDHEIQLSVWHARLGTDSRGRQRHYDRRDKWGDKVSLEYDGWKLISFPLAGIPKGHQVWLREIRIYGNRRNKELAMTGSVLIDDLRLVPMRSRPQASTLVGLVGPTTRTYTENISLFADIHNFTDAKATARMRVNITDRNENSVVDREFTIPLAAGKRKEVQFALKPENLGLFLPPFKVSGDILSADLPAASGRFERTLVMSNARILWDNFSDVNRHWLTAGWTGPGGFDVRQHRNWLSWLMGEGQRASLVTQVNARIRRVDLQAEKTAGADGKLPPGRFAMRIDYRDNAEIYNGHSRIPRLAANPLTGDRFFPGNSFRAGIWVRGDGSGALLQAVFLDYSNLADFWPGGWKRTDHGTRDVCRLDFKGWRYFEVGLPGSGIGQNERTGSSHAIDFPIELAAFRIVSWRDENAKKKAGDRTFAGTVYIGPVFAETQVAAVESLAVHVAYDDAEHRYAPDRGAVLTLQNGSLSTARTLGVNWVLFDRADDVLAKDTMEETLKAGTAKRLRLELSKHKAAIQGKAAPFRLQVTAFDKKDGSISATREIVLVQPDSRMLVTDFETDRAYYLYRKGATPGAVTATKKAHGGKRSLAVNWDSEEHAHTVIAIDPTIAGPATKLSVWVHGDGSGVLLYPILGDLTGIRNGKDGRQWDMLPTRVEEGDLQSAVRVDWTGWRELHFRLPLVPPTWRQKLPVRAFQPSYPYGLHFGIQAFGTEKPSGTLYLDDIRCDTHLLPAERLGLSLEHDGVGNVLGTNSTLHLVVDSLERNASRSVVVKAEILDWRNAVVSRFNKKLSLSAGARVRVPYQPKLGPGAYQLVVTLLEGNDVRRKIERGILITDLQPYLGEDWKEDLPNPWRLREPLQSLYTFISEDWDWLEHYPGNMQTRSARLRIKEIRELGGDPWMLLGYSAYYASGIGMEQFKSNAFDRRKRDIGHAVDVFLVPERIEDWDNYVNAMMRGIGNDVSGWVLWNNPDAKGGSLAVKPERFAKLLKSADKWRREYSAKRPLIIGGMTPGTTIPYLNELAKHEALEYLSGINVRLDVGVRSPEDAEVPQYVARLRRALKVDHKNKRQILLTDLDWAVEKSADGLDEFDQAAYVLRSALLLERVGIRPEVSISNGDFSRIGLGLTYRDSFMVWPHKITLPTLRPKAGWLGLARLRRMLANMTYVADIEVQDVIPQRTRCLVFRRRDGSYAAFAWRNNNAGQLSFARTGLTVTEAEDLFGTPMKVNAGYYSIGKVPALFILNTKDNPVAALRRLQVKDGKAIAWPQEVLTAFPITGKPENYHAQGGRQEVLAGRTVSGADVSLPALVFGKGGKEVLTVSVPNGVGIVLRKRFFLDDAGHTATIAVNGKAAGTWDLSRTDKDLSTGFRDSIYVIPATAVSGKAKIEVQYRGKANTVSWSVLAYRGGAFPLSAVGAVHVDQAVSHIRFARNMAGEPMKIGEDRFVNGIGVFAPSLIEISLNRQFKTYKAKVGVDAATEGRGSVVFEIYADGKKVWKSPVMSGLDEARDVEVDVNGVNRLRLVVTDGGDGNRLDAANWCDAELHQ